MSKNKDNLKTSIFLSILTGLILIFISLYLFYILNAGSSLHPSGLRDSLGFLGSFIYKILHFLVGTLSWLIPLGILLIGIHYCIPRFHLEKKQIFSLIGFTLIFIAWSHLSVELDQSFDYGKQGLGGGILGAILSFAFIKLFGEFGTKLIFLSLLLILLYIGTNGQILPFFSRIFNSLKPRTRKFLQDLKDYIIIEQYDDSNVPKKENKRKVLKVKSVDENTDSKKSSIIPSNEIDSNSSFMNNVKDIHHELIDENREEKVKQYIESGFAEAAASQTFSPSDFYCLPSTDLLDEISTIGLNINQKEIDNNAEILEKTLSDFGVNGNITEVSIGPTITEYEFQPARGIKVSKILNLADDLALSLATSGIRIQAPIPGKAAVGIEVPNKRARVVKIKEVITSNAFKESESKLTVALGKDISGHSVVTDLAKMPHVLIAGATGSGKSVCLNALIISILYRAKPYEVKFLMIDPKMVELGNYNDIPHLINPVVTDPKKAATALRWAVAEMEKRYKKFADFGVKDIIRYNKKCLEQQALGNFNDSNEFMPQIIIIIDELADLMMVAPADVEDAICRLAQMARAAGIHLVIATQRPSVDVITGIIKANIPSRIAFSVSSQVDSRTILDLSGAEKLLGRGDMLFYPAGLAKPKRMQCVFLSDNEIDNVVNYVKSQGHPKYDDTFNEISDNIDNEATNKESEYDEYIPDACRLFIENGQASISMLQRHFRIGYTRAARIIDQLELLGYVGPYEGSKPRQILITLNDYNKIFLNNGV